MLYIKSEHKFRENLGSIKKSTQDYERKRAANEAKWRNTIMLSFSLSLTPCPYLLLQRQISTDVGVDVSISVIAKIVAVFVLLFSLLLLLLAECLGALSLVFLCLITHRMETHNPPPTTINLPFHSLLHSSHHTSSSNDSTFFSYCILFPSFLFLHPTFHFIVL